MPVIDRVKAHYESYAGDRRAHLEVAEWGDDLGNGEVRPLVVFWKPYTLAEEARCFAGDKRGDPRGFAELVFHKAEDAAGKRMFTEVGDQRMLQYVAVQSVVARVAIAMMAAPSVSEQVEKLRSDDLRMAMFYLAEKLGKTIDEIEQMPVAAFRETLAFAQVRQEK